MIIRNLIILALLVSISIQTEAQNNRDVPLAAAKDWWHAITFGDTTYIKKHSTKELTVIFSNGRSFSRSEIIEQVAKHDPLAKITSEWSEIIKQVPNPQTVIITNRTVETIRGNTNILKFITVLTKAGSEWKVAAAQSTREIELSTRIPVAQAGKLEEYAGSYRTPTGATLMVEVRDTLLILKDPTGAETPLEAIGPGLFEPPARHTVGNVRLVFSRDSTGRVTSLNRITNKVITMPRIQ